MKVETFSYQNYRLVFSTLGGRPNSYCSETFDTYEQAVKHWEQTCRDRKQNDEYDSYWNKVPLVVVLESSRQTVITP